MLIIESDVQFQGRVVAIGQRLASPRCRGRPPTTKETWASPGSHAEWVHSRFRPPRRGLLNGAGLPREQRHEWHFFQGRPGPDANPTFFHLRSHLNLFHQPIFTTARKKYRLPLFAKAGLTARFPRPASPAGPDRTHCDPPSIANCRIVPPPGIRTRSKSIRSINNHDIPTAAQQTHRDHHGLRGGIKKNRRILHQTVSNKTRTLNASPYNTMHVTQLIFIRQNPIKYDLIHMYHHPITIPITFLCVSFLPSIPLTCTVYENESETPLPANILNWFTYVPQTNRFVSNTIPVRTWISYRVRLSAREGPREKYNSGGNQVN